MGYRDIPILIFALCAFWGAYDVGEHMERLRCKLRDRPEHGYSR